MVATGQQVGLFTGPAYTIYKALTAVKLAQRLTEQGIPSIPLFWMASEDHDLAEVNHCWVFDREHRPVRLQAGDSVDSQAPVGPFPVPENAVADLHRTLADLPFGGEVTDLAESAYAPGRTLGEAFRSLLMKLLGSHSPLFLDPLQPAVRELAAPILRSAAEGAGQLVGKVLDRGKELEAAGYHAQVHVDAESSLLFLLDRGLRLPLRIQHGEFYAPDRQIPARELRDRAADLSANALLRPVVQDYLLPTVAVVMGPAEVAYVAQAQVLFQELLGRMPVVAPRASGTLLDARCLKLMSRYGLSLGDFAHGEEALRERISRSLVPPSLARSLEDAAAEAGGRLEKLRNDLLSFDPTLADAAAHSRQKVLYQFGKIDRKVSREALRRDARAAQEAAFLVNVLYPDRRPQERFYSILPFLAQHGLGLIDRMYNAISLDCTGHQLLAI